jgi:hypothetical protein
MCFGQWSVMSWFVVLLKDYSSFCGECIIETEGGSVQIFRKTALQLGSGWKLYHGCETGYIG